MVNRGEQHLPKRRCLGVSPSRGAGKIFQVSAGESSLRPQTHRHIAGDLMLPDARDPHPLTDPIHLPSPRSVETPVVLPNPLARSFSIPTLMTLVCTTMVRMYEGLMIQTLDVIVGGATM